MDDRKNKKRVDEPKVNETKNKDKERKADAQTRDKVNEKADEYGEGIEAGNKSQAEGVIYDV